MSVSVLVSFA